MTVRFSSPRAVRSAVICICLASLGPACRPARAEAVVEAWRSASGEFSYPWSVSVNPVDGSCWVADSGHGQVVHLSSAGAELWRSASGAFSEPLSVSVNPTDGSSWVADGVEVVHLSADGVELSRSGLLLIPAFVAVNPTDGSCWATERDVYTIQIMHLAETGEAVWTSPRPPGIPWEPWSISVNPSDGSCWVGCTDQVVHFASTGQILWSSSTVGPASVVSVNSADGSCWVSDPWDDQILHLSAEGTELWRSSGSPTAQSRGYGSIAVSPSDGSCWVEDIGRGQVVHLSASGAEMSVNAGFSDSPAYIPASPGGLSANPTDGSCWVADNGHSQIVKLVPVVEANFSATPTSGLAPLPVTFTYLTPATPTWAAATAWQWDFGDGGTSDAQDPSYTYAKPGFYTVSLVASNAGGTATVTKPDYVLVSFPDVPVQPAFWALDQILACVDAGIVAGYSDGTYKPTDPVTRDQMAVYVSRALARGDAKVPTGPATATFSDVPIDYWAFKYVEYAVTQNVVKGYSDGTYKPADQVTRDQMAVFIARAIATPTAGVDLVDYTPPATATFPDVPTSFWAYRYVEYIAQPGIGVTMGYPDGDYHPEYVCTRDQMAVYVARAFGLAL